MLRKLPIIFVFLIILLGISGSANTAQARIIECEASEEGCCTGGNDPDCNVIGNKCVRQKCGNLSTEYYCGESTTTHPNLGEGCNTVPAWGVCFDPTCKVVQVEQCKWAWTFNYCYAGDRSEDWTPGIDNKHYTPPGPQGGADKGDTRNAPADHKGHVLPGICDPSRYDGVNANTACVSGGWYKTCCETLNGVQTGIIHHSREANCQDPDGAGPYGSVLTAPGITSCTPESITSPPPGGGGGEGCVGWTGGWCGSTGGNNCTTVSACQKFWWWKGYNYETGECPPSGGNSCSGFVKVEWGLDCGQGNACAVTLLSPSNGATNQPTTITFDWTDAPCWGYACARGSYTINYSERNYELQLRKIGESTWTTVVRLTGSDGPPAKNPDSIYTYTLPEQGSYEWRVKSFWELIAGGAPRQGSSFSSIWTFTTIINEGGWFQVKDADIQSGGNLVSKIPAQCTLPTCEPKFDLDGTGGYPGVCAYGGTTANFGSGTVSNKGWLANSAYAGRRYDYTFFEKLTPDGAFQTPITESEITGGDLISGFQSGGYIWRYRSGNLTINGTTNLGIRKVVLLVDGNLTLNGRITLDDGTGFFAAFVSGNIAVDPTVSHPNQPALEGVFMADGTISTGTRITSSDDRLYIRGMLAAWGGINLQRDLDPTKASGANNTSAAEFIEYAPDLVFSFPRELARRGIVWREIAP